MNTSLLQEDDFRQTLKTVWVRWQFLENNYPTDVRWWVRCIKCMVRRSFIQEGSERRQDRLTL
jgi:hypothetical protein